MHHLEQYKSELEQPYKKINKELEDMKRSYHDLANAMDMQRQKKQIDKDIDQALREVQFEIEKIKTSMGIRDEQAKKVEGRLEKVGEQTTLLG